jgi:hypothetical protein
VCQLPEQEEEREEDPNSTLPQAKSLWPKNSMLIKQLPLVTSAKLFTSHGRRCTGISTLVEGIRQNRSICLAPAYRGRQRTCVQLQQQDAVALVARVMREYERVHGRKPSRVILHKTSAYWPEELTGFKEALAQVADFDLIAVMQRAMRLFREGEYPPVRGTHACVADSLHILYTMGYIPFLRGYPRGYVPDPLTIVDHHGQASPERMCRELMALTKMNWNCADFATTAPITLRFARQVGEIMAEIPCI